MSKRNTGRRGRSRKRRSTGAAPAPEQIRDGQDGPPVAARVSAAPPARRRRQPAAAPARSGIFGADRDPGGVGPRPEAPWHPWPFSELLILVGAIASIVGVTSRTPRVLYAGIGAVLLGTLEFTVREHRSGYRSHTALLAAVPTALLHGGLAFGLFALGASGAALVLVPVFVDVPVFWFLFRYLRAIFEDARRERVFALRRR
jgi:hypothetical protein